MLVVFFLACIYVPPCSSSLMLPVPRVLQVPLVLVLPLLSDLELQKICLGIGRLVPAETRSPDDVLIPIS